MVYKVFRRPSIDLDAKRKSWEERPAHYIEVGAVIPDHGEVVDILYTSVSGPIPENLVKLKFKSGKVETYNYDELINSYQ